MDRAENRRKIESGEGFELKIPSRLGNVVDSVTSSSGAGWVVNAPENWV